MSASPLRLLILDDSPDDAKLVERALRTARLAFSAEAVTTGEAFAAALAREAFDAVLADYRLPGFSGRDALAAVARLRPGTPVIIVTGTLPDEAAAELLRLGAADYILKDRLSRLGSAVEQAVERRLVEAARREAEARSRALFEQAHDGVVLFDEASGAIVECNAEFERQAGRPPDAPRQLACDGEIELRRPDGGVLPIECRARPIELGGRRYVLATLRDITERRRAARALEEQLDELRRFQKVSVDRELRVEELKEEIRLLREQLAAGRPQ